MAQSKPSAPMTRFAAAEYRAELAKKRREKEEIDAAMRAKESAKDPAQAGIDLTEAERQGVVITLHQGTSKVKRAERKGHSVFDALSATLTAGERQAGHDLVEIFARRFGKGGTRDGADVGYIDKGRASSDFLTADMDTARREWNRHMAEFGRMSIAPLLLDKLCEDALYDQGQWRVHVKRFTGQANKDRQAERVKSICEELHAIMTGKKPY